ncbi:PTS ascorbate transporter subunit IIC [Georgenia sp. EYE_87]|uniref:PTS ascorbate transporter subunit IIC n=1 Tax=Georgenia sp. EYE_87 TaxID=2853448 RepID=UPI00200527BA|nr:PTS ascorbate transporter subunit IIC [Georgenia sp. EYE_87]MCK6211626.1 PTS ascorbate transporter subunit IIC [Georgenia sp. EYE_87]
MELLQDILTGIANNIFNQVPILIGLIALAGLLLQRKPVEAVVGGTIRAVVGVVILMLGVEIFVGGLVAFQAIVASAVGLDPPAASSTLNDFLGGQGSAVPLIIAVGFAVHLLLVRVFRAARYVYLTGHLMFWMSIVIAASLVEVFTDIPQTTLVVAGAVIIACYWTLQPLWVAPLMKRLMGHDQFGLGHTTSTVALIAGYGSKALRLGDAERHDSEKLKLPRQVSFFKDINVSTALIIAVIMLVAIAFADSAVVQEQMAGSELLPWAWGLTQALRFAAGIAILLFGVRMFLAEIVPAFKGISDKVLPGTRPALDIPVVFPKAPTAVMIGFLSSTVVFLVLMGIFAAAGWFVLVPPMIMLFFGGGSGGVFGNAVAGWRGAVFGGLVNGILLAFGQWIGWGLYDNTAPELATLADPDWYAVGWLLIGAANLLEPLGTAAVWVVAAAVLLATVAILMMLSRRRTTADVAPTATATSTPAAGSADATTAGAGAGPASAGTTSTKSGTSAGSGPSTRQQRNVEETR